MTQGLLQTLAVPERWRGRPCWRVLEIGFDSGQAFLDLWQAWRQDPQRPRLLHYVAVEPDTSALQHLVRTRDVAAKDASALAALLAARCWGLTPGFHRFTFDEGRVLLTLCIGAVGNMLREQRFDADSIWLGDAATTNWIARDAYAAKALARRCRRGTQLGARLSTLPPAWRTGLQTSGFVAAQARSPDGFCAIFDPAWTPRKRMDRIVPALLEDMTSALVIGAGIAGAAVAASLARRGLQVQVLDAHASPAQGASGLPAGLLVPHLSADDCLRSRLSRAGLRSTIEFARDRLEVERDWQLSGVLEVRPDASRALTGGGANAACREWSLLATAAQKSAAGLDPTMSSVWHSAAGWIRPGAIVQALMDSPQIRFLGNTIVHTLQPVATGWQALRADGSIAAQAPLVVLAAGPASARLTGLSAALLQPVRGQVSFDRHGGVRGDTNGLGSAGRTDDASPAQTMLPPFPVNGHGSLLPDVPLGDGTHGSIFGATYRPGDDNIDLRAEEHQENGVRLGELLPRVLFQSTAAARQACQSGWAGVRAVTPDRLPMVGPLPVAGVDAAAQPTLPRMPLWVCTAMGSRGLSQAIGCAELLAGRLFNEPLAMEAALASALDVQRFYE